MAATCPTSQGEGIFGIPDEEVGIVVNGITANTTGDTAELKNRAGNVVGDTTYNCRQEITIDGGAKLGEDLPWLLGAAATLANALPNRIPGDDARGGTFIVKGVTDTWSGEGYQLISTNMTYRPFVKVAGP